MPPAGYAQAGVGHYVVTLFVPLSRLLSLANIGSPLLSENKCSLLFQSLREWLMLSVEGLHCRWPQVTFDSRFGYRTINGFIVSIKYSIMCIVIYTTIERHVSNFYGRIRPEWLLYDAECDLLAIAKFLVNFKNIRSTNAKYKKIWWQQLIATPSVRIRRSAHTIRMSLASSRLRNRRSVLQLSPSLRFLSRGSTPTPDIDIAYDICPVYPSVTFRYFMKTTILT